MATPFTEYYNKALANYAPARQQAVAAADTTLADRGLGNSTAAVGKLASIGSQYDAQARSAAEQSRQFDTQQATSERNTALQWWDAINNYNMGRTQLQPKWKGAAWAAVPSWYKSYQNNNALGSQAIGDGAGKVVKEPTYDYTDIGGGGPTASTLSLDAAQANAAASRALQSRQLDEAIREYNDKKAAATAGTDPWAQAMGVIGNAVSTDKDPNTPGIQRAYLPSDVINQVGMLGVDLIGAAKDEKNPNHDKALAALKTLYPGGTWTKWLTGDMPAPAVSGQPLHNALSVPFDQGQSPLQYAWNATQIPDATKSVSAGWKWLNTPQK